MGMTAIPMAGGEAMLETDTTEILSALENGPVTFVAAFSDNGETMPTRCTMTGLGMGGDYICSYVFTMDVCFNLIVIVGTGYIVVMLAPMEMGSTSDDHINALIDAKLAALNSAEGVEF